MNKAFYILLALVLFTMSSFNTIPNNLFAWDNNFVENKEIVVQMYPNPASSYVVFEFPVSINKSNIIQVYNFIGKKVFETNITNSRIVINLESYYRGLYVFQVREKTGQIIESGKFQVVK